MSQSVAPGTSNTEVLMILGAPSLRHRSEAVEYAVLASVGCAGPVFHNTVLLGRSLVPPAVSYEIHRPGVPPQIGMAKWGALIAGSAKFPGPIAPLFCLAGDAESGWRPYSQIEVSGEEALFVALDGEELLGDPDDTGTVLGWLEDLGQRHRRHRPQLNNHQRWFINAAPGTEIEQKFTLSGQPDIWHLALKIRGLLAEGELPGWIPEHGNDFEQWSFPTHLFEVPGADGERGDLAFIPAVDGRWIIRRKWFDADAAIRREELTDGVVLPADPDLVAVAQERLGETVVPIGTYVRVRYNVMLESLDTGHVFSIMFDECSTDGVPDVLHQVEVEYVRSRALARPGAYDEVLAEFESLNVWTRLFLDAHNVGFVEDHLSKLSWLKNLKQRDKVP